MLTNPSRNRVQSIAIGFVAILVGRSVGEFYEESPALTEALVGGVVAAGTFLLLHGLLHLRDSRRNGS